ncbi:MULTISPECIES: response regulator [Asticcacaulis]|uniref:response regulator n=1 Tax=Asticcacaulis TaxID=76890 RepID=UPI001AE8F57F|nr:MULTISPECIES: response regulator [Asticcacaulis]MBP2158720.1 DNA-binding response OmpR family regulator [Asticcacaulis solisilvae]MDR6799766.1 DNA-binding response OmpR family regulator [Asticcacaulis sp. BE141]
MRVLIVEDDQMLAQTLMWVAEEQGDEARVCHNGRDAIATARAIQPDLVVVDMELPDMDGTEVCRTVRADAETAQATVVAHTAFSDTALRQKAKAAGCHAFFVKGVDFRNLMALFTTMHARLATS